jgi:hypothetical protein
MNKKKTNKVDDFVKGQKSRRSRGGGSPELLDLTIPASAGMTLQD